MPTDVNTMLKKKKWKITRHNFSGSHVHWVAICNGQGRHLSSQACKSVLLRRPPKKVRKQWRLNFVIPSPTTLPLLFTHSQLLSTAVDMQMRCDWVRVDTQRDTETFIINSLITWVGVDYTSALSNVLHLRIRSHYYFTTAIDLHLNIVTTHAHGYILTLCVAYKNLYSDVVAQQRDKRLHNPRSDITNKTLQRAPNLHNFQVNYIDAPTTNFNSRRTEAFHFPLLSECSLCVVICCNWWLSASNSFMWVEMTIVK